MAMTRVKRPVLADLDLSIGKRTRLHRLLYTFGPANGTLLLLPIDQGLEHGPRDFFPNPPSKDPGFQLRLAKEGNFSGIVYQIGIAEKYMNKYAGAVPLVLKLNGKTEIPPDKAPISPCIATVEDAVRLGADAVGYTLYVGSTLQAEDFVQFRKVREDADRYGMPIIVWAYPRGEAIEAKGGRDSLYAVDYAARVACELGADIVKVNVPKAFSEKDAAAPKPYNTLQPSREEAVRMVVESAGRTLLLFSGGEMQGEGDVIGKARVAMENGATGLIFGRNIWQRPFDEALKLSQEISDMMKEYGA
ncbi:MAG: Fructose-bisphosphate aldolase, archaeal class I [Ktedonobacterales bacterium]|jgi:class I fructose-bisphosphate aldolase|nr:MAG: Fructose-bisphosphate aldolase, archaeal class I [Ktedonobacterales bacterium]